mmetsp:Transcript_9860/g.9539  ORF Transcript_9860/g.9539 Transcript_9860/m.9539 type:complete len:94 (+) Transcript_9860:53-334(+)
MTLPRQVSFVRTAYGASSSSLSSTASSFSTTTSRPPNKMSSVYSQMKITCSNEMKAYAECVIQHHQDGSLKQKTCELEFSSVHNCFRSIRQNK